MLAILEFGNIYEFKFLTSEEWWSIVTKSATVITTRLLPYGIVNTAIIDKTEYNQVSYYKGHPSESEQCVYCSNRHYTIEDTESFIKIMTQGIAPVWPEPEEMQHLLCEDTDY